MSVLALSKDFLTRDNSSGVIHSFSFSNPQGQVRIAVDLESVCPEHYDDADNDGNIVITVASSAK